MHTLEYMATFAAVIDEGSFTAAAQALGLSKPVVSKQITELENRFGVKLLNRTTRRLHMTEAGVVFYGHCKRIVAEAKEAETAIGPLQSEPRGTLRISAPQSLGFALLPQAIPKFHQRYPALNLEVQITGRHVDLVEEGYDVSLRVAELKDSTLKARKITRCQFMVCATPDYWNEHGHPQHPTDLEVHNCLLYTQSPNFDHWQFTDKNGKSLSVAVNGNLRSNDGALLLNAVLAGQGILFGPDFMFNEYIKRGNLEPTLSNFYKPSTALYAVYPYSKFVSSKLRVFIDFLMEEWGSL
jgi:DNA-binding transcriptional LysR family regulator